MINTSQTTKARLLHYFPPQPGTLSTGQDEPVDSWCGFHLDHSLLTGLCSVRPPPLSPLHIIKPPNCPLPFTKAMYLRQETNAEPSIVPSPSPSSGLYIRTRGGDLTKVTIPQDSIAFQTGEAFELATGGRLRATPHCVRVGASKDAERVSRETFALFMQPNTDAPLTPTVSFGQFSKRVFDEHYETSSM